MEAIQIDDDRERIHSMENSPPETVDILVLLAPHAARHFGMPDLARPLPGGEDWGGYARWIGAMAGTALRPSRQGVLWDDDREVVVVFNNNPVGRWDRSSMLDAVKRDAGALGLTEIWRETSPSDGEDAGYTAVAIFAPARVEYIDIVRRFAGSEFWDEYVKVVRRIARHHLSEWVDGIGNAGRSTDEPIHAHQPTM